MSVLLALLAAAVVVLPAQPPAKGGTKLGRPRWVEIGKTGNDNPIRVDARSLRTAPDGITHAVVHVRLLTPGKSPKGPVTSSKTVVMLDCARKSVAIPEHWYYLDEKAGKIYQHTFTDRPGYGPALGGSMTFVVMEKLCAPGAVERYRKG
jgi:hypothetical protein